MTWSSITANKVYQVALRNSIRSKWFALWMLVPVSVYFIFRLTESRWLYPIVMKLPMTEGKSPEFYLDLFHLLLNEMLWLSGFVLLTWFFARVVPTTIWTSWIDKFFRKAIVPFAIISFSFLTSLYVSFKTLESFPNSSDEYAYVYQARTISEGKLWQPAHDYPDFFYFNHIAQVDGISVSRFPPGWPLILSSAIYVGIHPGLVNPLIGLIMLIVFYNFAKRRYSQNVATWSLAILSASCFFIFNAASYFSHACCALFAICFVDFVYRYLENKKIHLLILAGFFIGLLAIVRYYTAAIIFLPFGVMMITKLKLDSIKSFFWMGVGGAAPIAFFLWYNYSITGNALIPVTMWAYSDEALGFVKGHTVLKGFEHVARWMGMFVYWVAPSILILYIVFMVKKIRDRIWCKPEDLAFVLLLAGYFFYYEIGGNQYGPRFFFEAFPFVVVFVVSNVIASKEKWSYALLFAGLIIGIIRIPYVSAREHQVIEERKDVYNLVRAEHVENSVVLVSTFTGVIRPMPVGDLTRNDEYYLDDVLYARDLGELNPRLLDYYPDRKFYRYERSRGEVHGRLVRIK